MVKRKGTSRDKWKKKQWFTLIAPKMFNEIVIGETPAEEDKQLVGRTIEVSAGDLTGDARKGHLKVLLLVSRVDGTQARTEIQEVSTSKGYLKSITRRKSSKVDVFIKSKTKDNFEIVFKPSAFTLKKAQNSAKKDLRAKLLEISKKTVPEKTFEELITETLNGSFGNAAKDELKKIAPMKNVDVRVLGVVKRP